MRIRSLLALVPVLGMLAYLSPPAAAVPGDPAGPVDGPSGRGIFPEGYNGFLVFMATGSIPATDSFFLDGSYFQSHILGRTPAQIAQNRAAALSYFQTRFGIAHADTNSNVSFFGFYADPRINYRAYVISGLRVPDAGYQVDDGGWIALVTNPNGLTLGGAFPGVHVPANTVFSFGDYKVEVTGPCNGPKPQPLVIHYQCNHPLVPTISGGEVFDCNLQSDEFGNGLSEGVTTPVIQDGQLRPNGRTVLTFSNEGGL